MIYKTSHTFPKGGIHPPEYKLTQNVPIKPLPVPKSVIIPLSQHIGAASAPVVAKGDHVKTGQVIAAANGFVSSNIHSSVSGVVSKIDTVIDASGYRQSAIFIDVQGDEWIDSIDRSVSVISEIELAPEQIIEKCRELGIVGLGGATFPSHVKLAVPKDKKCSILIINGVECEPYLTSDHRLMLEKGEETLIGIKILMKALHVEKAMVGIESNKPDAIEHLKELSKRFDGISIHSLTVKYPQGAEKQLIKTLTNREVPSGKLPIETGAVVHNVATAYAVYEAVQKNKPLIERVVTITGKSLSAPGNYLVRIGSPVNSLIEAAGGLPDDTGKIVSGGPMMGKALQNTGIPTSKGMSGIILFPASESIRGETGPCIRCAKCIAACPMNLEPHLLANASMKAMFERTESERITDCVECGSCSYTCPAGRPLLDYIRLGKSTVIKMARERNLK
ncbi:MAG: electron transport complex subunit RsxC [Bacteroidales bacterium]|nr:electron transport complex subunit RsxC [Bacteroidales bacterium]